MAVFADVLYGRPSKYRNGVGRAVASLNYTGHITLYLPKIVWVEPNAVNEVMMHSCFATAGTVVELLKKKCKGPHFSACSAPPAPATRPSHSASRPFALTPPSRPFWPYPFTEVRGYITLGKTFKFNMLVHAFD